jgi:sulfur transfer protein SufE
MRRIRPAGSGLQALTAMASRRWADGSFILVAILLLGGILAGCGYGGGARVRNAAAFAPMPAIQLRGVAAGQHRARTHRPRAIKCDASFSSGNTCSSLPKELQRLARWIGESADMKEGAMRLVQLGDEMASQNGEKIPTSMRKEALKVPGCVSTVLVVSSVGEKGEVSLLGEADARVARGMLALLVRGLAGENASTVATVDSEKLISLARLRDWLPRGRNDGMTNMVTAVPSPCGGLFSLDCQCAKTMTENGWYAG